VLYTVCLPCEHEEEIYDPKLNDIVKCDRCEREFTLTRMQEYQGKMEFDFWEVR
jgi:hypothetical protein